MIKLNRTIKILIFLIILSFIINTSYAEKFLSPDKFKYKKEILANMDNDYTFFIIDEDIYKHSNYNLNDLRIIDDLGANIPFMIYTKKNSKGDINPRFIINDLGKSTRILIKNEEIQNLELDKMVFDIDGEFERSIQIESNLIDVTDIYRINFDDEIKEKLDVDMGNQIHTEDIIITIKNNEDDFLNIKDIKMIFNQKIIVFKTDKDRSYDLYFKTDQFINKPIYDIGISEDEIPNIQMNMSNLRKLTLVEDELIEESKMGKDEMPSDNNTIYKMIILFVVSILMFIIIRIYILK